MADDLESIRAIQRQRWLATRRQHPNESDEAPTGSGTGPPKKEIITVLAEEEESSVQRSVLAAPTNRHVAATVAIGVTSEDRFTSGQRPLISCREPLQIEESSKAAQLPAPSVTGAVHPSGARTEPSLPIARRSDGQVRMHLDEGDTVQVLGERRPSPGRDRVHRPQQTEATEVLRQAGHNDQIRSKADSLAADLDISIPSQPRRPIPTRPPPGVEPARGPNAPSAGSIRKEGGAVSETPSSASGASGTTRQIILGQTMRLRPPGLAVKRRHEPLPVEPPVVVVPSTEGLSPLVPASTVIVPEPDSDEDLFEEMLPPSFVNDRPKVGKASQAAAVCAAAATTATIRRGAAAPLRKRERRSQESPLRLLTWNLDGLWEHEPVARALAFIDLVRILKPTVMYLQEVTAPMQRLIQRHLSEPYQIVEPAESTNFTPEGLAHLRSPSQNISKIPYYCLMLVSKHHFRILKPRTPTMPTSFQVAGGTKYVETKPLEGCTYYYPTSVMGRHYLQVEVEMIDPPNTQLTLATSHLESTKEYAKERQYQLEQCLVAMSETSPIVASRGVTIFGGDLNLREPDVREVADTFRDLGCGDLWELLGRPPNCRTTWQLRMDDGTTLSHVKARFDRLFIMKGPEEKIKPKSMRLLGTHPIDTRDYNFRISDHFGVHVEFYFEDC